MSKLTAKWEVPRCVVRLLVYNTVQCLRTITCGEHAAMVYRNSSCLHACTWSLFFQSVWSGYLYLIELSNMRLVGLCSNFKHCNFEHRFYLDALVP